MTWVAVAIGGAALIGAGADVYSSDKAANAAKNAQGVSQGENQQIVGMESPYNQAGVGALGALDYGMGIGPNTPPQGGAGGVGYGSLNAPFTQANFNQQNPYFNFVAQQGSQGVLNNDASSQGALSGSAMKDLMSYRSGLASTAYPQAFQMYQQQQQNIYGRLANIANLGQSAASQTAQSGTSLAGQAAQSATNIGGYQATGLTNAGNTVASAGSTIGLLGTLNGINSQNGYGGPSGVTPGANAYGQSQQGYYGSGGADYSGVA